MTNYLHHAECISLTISNAARDILYPNSCLSSPFTAHSSLSRQQSAKREGEPLSIVFVRVRPHNEELSTSQQWDSPQLQSTKSSSWNRGSAAPKRSSGFKPVKMRNWESKLQILARCEGRTRSLQIAVLQHESDDLTIDITGQVLMLFVVTCFDMLFIEGWTL